MMTTTAPKPEPFPYVGPRPFDPHKNALFFGRDSEAAEITDLVVAHPVVLLYSSSGAGKTSLLNAGVLPALVTREECDVLPVARLAVPNPKQAEIGNICVFNALASWAADNRPEELRNLSVRSYLEARDHREERSGVDRLRVLVFDQFEEVFTMHPERWQDRREFFRQIADALAGDRLLRVLF